MIPSHRPFQSIKNSLRALALFGSVCAIGCSSSVTLDPFPMSVEFPVDYQGNLARSIEGRTQTEEDVSFEEKGPGGFGLSVKIVRLDGAERETCLARAASSEDVAQWLKTQLTHGRAELLSAPEVQVYNKQNAWVRLIHQVSYIRDFELEMGKGSLIANPIVDVVEDGMALEVTPHRSADGASSTFFVRLTTSELNIPAHEVKLPGSEYEVTIQVPISLNQEFVTECALDEDQTMMLGPIHHGEERRVMILLEGKWIDDLADL